MVTHTSYCHNMCSLQHFLCCMELEKGAVALGWFSFIKNFLTMIFFCGVIVARMTMECSQILKVLQFVHIFEDLTMDRCVYVTEQGYVVLFATVMIITYIGCTYLSYTFVQATKTRKHKKVIPFMTYLFVMTITSFLSLFFASLRSLIFGLLTGFFYFYFLLCVGALYERFLKEYSERQKVLAEIMAKSEPPQILITAPPRQTCNCKCHERAKERTINYGYAYDDKDLKL